MDGLRRRAPEALAGLHAEYAGGIYSLALRVVRHPADAEDITQDVLIRAFERLPRDREVLLRPWLYRLTLNRCYDHLRRAARRPLAAPPELEAPAPHDPYEQSELQGLLEASLGDLTRRQRAALLLKDVHGLTLVEVATCLDLTPGSVEVLLARARRAFRASFERRCTAAGRPVPRSAGALLALPLLPLPATLGSPPLTALGTPSLALPAALLPLAPVAGAPFTAATGGGIGAVLGLPASVKTAVLVAAAAASLGSAELVATRADHRPPRAPAAAAAVAPGGGGAKAAVAHTRATAGSGAPPRPSPSASASPSPPAIVEVTASPSPLGSPVAAPTPVTTPLGSAPPSPTPDARATTPGSPSPAPTAPPTTEPSPSPSPGASSSPDASPAPSPGP